jgi:putative colanic acid biosynthesis acetyltransferase WcaF
MDQFSERCKPSLSISNRARRCLWHFSWCICAMWTPPSFWRWRLIVLRLFGARVARRCDVRGTAYIWDPRNLELGYESIIAEKCFIQNISLVSIGSYSILSREVSVFTGTHDYNVASHPLLSKKVAIGDKTWLCAQSFVAPGTIIATGAVLGARSFAYGALDPWAVYSGNPCKKIKTRQVF